MYIRKGKAKFLAMASGLAVTLAAFGAVAWLRCDDLEAALGEFRVRAEKR